MRQTIRTTCLLAAGVAAGAVLTARPAGAGDETPLEKRVAELERIVVRDPMRPNTAVVDRLDRIEKSLSGNGAVGDLKTPEDFKKAVARLAKDQDEQERRIKMLESDRRQPGDPDTDRAVKELKSLVQDNGRSIKDLDNRVKRVENRF